MYVHRDGPIMTVCTFDKFQFQCLFIVSAAIAKETKEVVQKEEQEATAKAQMTQEIADSAQRDLDEALPALVRKHDMSRLCTMLYCIYTVYSFIA